MNNLDVSKEEYVKDHLALYHVRLDVAFTLLFFLT